jgi:two-component system, OmpR family, sensor kinase
MNRSIQARLSVWLSVLVMASAAIAGVASFSTAFHEANELQDGQLKQVAALITPQSLALLETPGRPLDLEQPLRDGSSLVIQRLTEGEGPLALVSVLSDGIQNVTLGDTSWRIIVKTLDDKTRVVVAQPTAGRDDIAHSSAIATTAPFIIIVPVLLVVLGLAVQQMFRPLTALSSALDHRDQHDLSEISSSGIPVEVKPFVVAINRLLARVRDSMEEQRRFVADAAHELRSPLTALTLQAERFGAADLSACARERLSALRRGLSRTRSMVEQLLTLARVQDCMTTPVSKVPIEKVYRHVLEDLMPLAEEKNIDIGLVSAADATIEASDVDLKVMLKNLIDNAIRYTPEGGRVDLSITRDASSISLCIADTGPGIAPDELDRVFQPFYRIAGSATHGSGLGLSIVRSIAARIGAEIRLNNRRPSGLEVRVKIRTIDEDDPTYISRRPDRAFSNT